jgi:hypothetical protein
MAAELERQFGMTNLPTPTGHRGGDGRDRKDRRSTDDASGGADADAAAAAGALRIPCRTIGPEDSISIVEAEHQRRQRLSEASTAWWNVYREA